MSRSAMRETHGNHAQDDVALTCVRVLESGHGRSRPQQREPNMNTINKTGRILPVITEEAVQLSLPGIPEAHKPKTVVPTGYKNAYRARAAAMGRTSKAAKRSNSDWLAQELEAECIGKGGAFDLSRFLAIFTANTGEDALARWPSRTNGWEGRLRMSGAIVMRGVVGKRGTFRTPDGETDIAALAREGDELAGAFLARWDGRNGN